MVWSVNAPPPPALSRFDDTLDIFQAGSIEDDFFNRDRTQSPEDKNNEIDPSTGAGSFWN